MHQPPPASSPSFCVIIPMYNEEAGAEACVAAVCATLDKLPNRSALCAIDDGSRDRTGEILARLAAAHPKLSVATHPVNRGYGSALRTGISHAAQNGFDYALFMDSDLTNDPADIPRFLAEMRRGADVIKASRFAGGSGMQGVPFRRAVVSRLGNRVARLLFGVSVRDCTNGFRAVRVSLLARTNLRENGFAIIVEELYQLKFLARSYAEVPVILTSRRQGLRPTSFSYTPAIFWKYFRYALKARLGIRPEQEK